MSGSFDEGRHDHLLDVLAKSSFVTDYTNLCRKYENQIDVMARGPDQRLLLESFRRNATNATEFKRFKTFAFEAEQVRGWTWTGKLVVQRYGMFEPMLEGEDEQKRGVGSTWLSLALDAGARQNPPISWSDLGPPALPSNRPCYDGNPAMIEPFVIDLVALFRKIKDVIRRSDW